MVLGLGESVSIQSMTVTIQALRATQPTFRWYLRAFRREAGTAVLLGAACGAAVGLIVWLWRGAALAGLAIGAGTSLAMWARAFFGLTAPGIRHAPKFAPKIAARPGSLAVTDAMTLLFYFSFAALPLCY